MKKMKDREVRIRCEALRRIRQHARSSSKAEICGVLIGTEQGGATSIDASIPGANAVEAGTHVTFTQDTWQHIYEIKDRDYPDDRIVGWYHSHPGFGVFLSDHDTFIHKNFFSAPGQVAWVYDPHSDEEGCFGWVNGRLERLPRIVFSDEKGGEGAGETGKPEPIFLDGEEEELPRPVAESRRKGDWMATAVSVLIYTIFFVAGVLLSSYYFLTHPVLIPVDPSTGQPLMMSQPEPGSGSEPWQQGQAPGTAQPQTAPSPRPPAAKGKP
jgi:proteasome lid subunit RPN8/RPN11